VNFFGPAKHDWAGAAGRNADANNGGESGGAEKIPAVGIGFQGPGSIQSRDFMPNLMETA
jgi:hypothetical protein